MLDSFTIWNHFRRFDKKGMVKCLSNNFEKKESKRVSKRDKKTNGLVVYPSFRWARHVDGQMCR